jgi:hypothetical protein
MSCTIHIEDPKPWKNSKIEEIPIELVMRSLWEPKAKRPAERTNHRAADTWKSISESCEKVIRWSFRPATPGIYMYLPALNMCGANSVSYPLNILKMLK